MKKIPLLFWVFGSLFLTIEPLLAQDSFARAERVANVLGIGRSGACSSCHAMNSEQTLYRWARVYNKGLNRCINNQALTAKEKLYCLSGQSLDEVWQLKPSTLGFWSAGLHLNPMKQLMQDAFGAEQAQIIQDQLRMTTTMPLRAQSLLTEAEFQDVRDWVDEDLPFLDELLSPYQGPTQCEAFLSPDMQSHLQSMHEKGWQKRNKDRGMFMFGCNAQSEHCFEQQRQGQDIFPDVSRLPDLAAWKADSNSQLRVLADLSEETQYWIRSSADGRFIAFGGSPSGVVDLQSRLTDPTKTRIISVNAYYDPGFFPDDSAFVFQGNRTAICSNSLLKNPNTRMIDFSEDACSVSDEVQLPLYQAVGASLDGADYLAATGDFLSDIGAENPFIRSNQSLDLNASPRARLLLQPLEYDGQRWIRRTTQAFDTPWELDWGLAPSNRLLISRFEGRVEGDMKHLGYQLYQLTKNVSSGGLAQYSKNMVGRLCFDGLKVGFSFDDRFIVSYGYIKPDQFALLGYASAEDPEFQARLREGTSNLFLFDLWTQKLHTLTHMGPGQFALFPHFRSDGWIYFMAYDQKAGQRRLMAIDQAIMMQKTSPMP